VYECLVAGVPFLTHAVGGVPELIHPDDHDRVLVDGPNGKALARRILQVLQDGLRPARPWVRVAVLVHLACSCAVDWIRATLVVMRCRLSYPRAALAWCCFR
jgi:hypothetical protein